MGDFEPLNCVLLNFAASAQTSRDNTEATSETLLRSLNFLYSQEGDQERLEKALQIIDSQRIREISSPSGRHAFTCDGEHRKLYFCLPGFCSCEHFFQMAKKTPSPVQCKHLLAVQLAPFFQAYKKDVRVSEFEFSNILSTCEGSVWWAPEFDLPRS